MAFPPMSEMSPAERQVAHEYFRRRYLPGQIEAARRKLTALENEARRYGMNELLTNPAHLDKAWDRAVWNAQDAVDAHGGSIGFGEAIRNG